MNRTNIINHSFLKSFPLLIAVLLLGYVGYSQQTPTPQDTTKTGVSLGTIKMANPNSIVSKYTYDP
ncbi:MAG: hypothetical protein AAF901_09600, partial [Bacteroidota bacterium]